LYSVREASGGQRALPFGNPLKGFALENPVVGSIGIFAGLFPKAVSQKG